VPRVVVLSFEGSGGVTSLSADKSKLPAASGASGPLGIATPAGIAVTLALVAAFIALFWRWFEVQHRHSIGALEDWGHAYVIPFISIWLIWRHRAELSRAPVCTFWPGILPFVAGIAAYFFCVIGIKNHMLQGFSMILALAGLVLFLLGPAVFRVAFLPIAFLAFGVTVSQMIMNLITFRLQLVASQGSWFVLSLIGQVVGFRVDVSGNALEVMYNSRVFPLNVAEACAGMRMVIAFIALAAAVALISCRHWWQRIALLLLAVPVAVSMNVLRVVVLGVLTLIDPALAAGDAHMFIGTILLVPGLGLFLLVLWMLNRIFVDEPEAAPAPAPAAGASTMDWSWLARPAFVVSLAIMLGCAAGMSAGIRFFGIYTTKLAIRAEHRLNSIATETASWSRLGSDRKEPKEVEAELGTDNYISRLYVRREAPGADTKSQRGPVGLEFHAAYYTGMVDTVPHVPERCMVGAGWQITEGPWTVEIPVDRSTWTEDPSVPGVWRVRDANGKRIRLPRDADRVQLRVTKYEGPRGARLYAGYFFLANGGWTPTAEGVRLLAFDLKDDYAYYCKVQFSSNTVAGPEELAAQAGTLLSELYPEIMRCVPDWTEVAAGRYPDDNPRRKADASTPREAPRP
jgi:exosortase